MRSPALSILLAATVFLAGTRAGAADAGPVTGSLSGNVLAAGDNKVLILSPEGRSSGSTRPD